MCKDKCNALHFSHRLWSSGEMHSITTVSQNLNYVFTQKYVKQMQKTWQGSTPFCQHLVKSLLLPLRRKCPKKSLRISVVRNIRAIPTTPQISAFFTITASVTWLDIAPAFYAQPISHRTKLHCWKAPVLEHLVHLLETGFLHCRWKHRILTLQDGHIFRM